LLSFAQQGKVWRIGVFIGGTRASSGHLSKAFFQGMENLGYAEGRNVKYEERYGEGNSDNINRLAKELVAAKVDLIWAPSTAAAVAARKLTGSIPVVFAVVGDPVGSGLVHSLATPQGNATGVSTLIPELGGKQVEILDQIAPKVRRIGILRDPGDGASAIQLPGLQSAGRAFRKELLIVDARGPEEFEAAFARLKQWRAEGLLILATVVFYTHREKLLRAANANQWVTVNSLREWADAGGTVAYGPDFVDNCRRSATYVDRILRGAKPGDLPVEQPVKFDFVINLQAAKQIGLKISQAMLARADHVIQHLP
jgi:putative ABC transport system substrate-binding protein